MTAAPAPRDWDAATYDRLAAPQEAWARELLERLPLHGDETVLDAGCGSGRATRLLLERLPEGRVVGVDASPSMIEVATAAFAGEPRVALALADLCDLDLPEPVDAVFSNATFHWIADHDRLFRRLHDALRPGGRLVAQCGGAGNVLEITAVIRAVNALPHFATHLAGVADPWHFAGPEETMARLAAAGFADVECWLEPRTVRPSDPVAFARAVCLGAELDHLPPELHDGYVRAVLERCAQPLTLEYIRLNLDARRP